MHFQPALSDDDIEMWQKAGRHDILEWVSPIQLGTHFVYDIWINPVTGEMFKDVLGLGNCPIRTNTFAVFTI